jgi:dihydrofolate reductase
MPKVKVDITVSLDGYVAGPNQSEENPLGEGGEDLHEWKVKTKGFEETHGREGNEGETGVNNDVGLEIFENVGACIMGRKMFGPIGGGDWGEGSWKGWWGDDPPYHCPVYVLTHHEREPVDMQGGTTYHFVTDGIESALEQAKAAAGGADVLLLGGAECINQYLAAGLVDEIELHVAPIVLGDGERLLEGIGTGVRFEHLRTIGTPEATHLRYGMEAA